MDNIVAALRSVTLRMLADRLDDHIRAATRRDPSVVLLSVRDEARLLQAIENPPEPNEALRRAFTP